MTRLPYREEFVPGARMLTCRTIYLLTGEIPLMSECEIVEADPWAWESEGQAVLRVRFLERQSALDGGDNMLAVFHVASGGTSTLDRYAPIAARGLLLARYRGRR